MYKAFGIVNSSSRNIRVEGLEFLWVGISSHSELSHSWADTVWSTSRFPT